MNQTKNRYIHYSISTVVCLFCLIVLFSIISIALKPWAKFIFQADKAVVSCQDFRSPKCTSDLILAKQFLNQFTLNTQYLSNIPLFKWIPKVLIPHANLLSSISDLQSCSNYCENFNVSSIFSELFDSASQIQAFMDHSKIWNLLLSRNSIFASYEQGITLLNSQNQKFKPLLPHASELLGITRPITYRILLQNNKEIRPSGGFMGSFATITVEKMRVVELNIEDIYVPDGQIKGYVAEPFGVYTYLFDGEHPGWRLRDANWHPDFPTAAKSIEWFFVEGGQPSADVMLAINLSSIERLLTILGPIFVPDYNVTIDEQNIYAITQAQAEHNFFPGSTQKGDFLRALGASFKQKLTTISTNQALSLISQLINELDQGEIFFSSPNPELGLAFKQAHIDGSLPLLSCTAGLCEPSVISLVESNVGSTKANCCISRNFTDTITAENSNMVHTFVLEFLNTSLGQPEPPYHFGGGYKNYLRFVLPNSFQLIKASINGKVLAENEIDTETFENYIFWGFLNQIEGGESAVIEASFSALSSTNDSANILLLKQPGVSAIPWTIRGSNGQIYFQDELRKHTSISVQINHQSP